MRRRTNHSKRYELYQRARGICVRAGRNDAPAGRQVDAAVKAPNALTGNAHRRLVGERKLNCYSRVSLNEEYVER